MVIAPIALFIYNRLRHTMRTVESLQGNDFSADSDLFIFSDGPRTEADNEKILAVRDYCRTITGFKKVTLIERHENLGLAGSIISGVSEIITSHGQAIILEDDMITSPFFLRFMNEALEFYKSEERVCSIVGYLFPVRTKLPETFFLSGADCWGWATWKRGWELFEPDGRKLLDSLRAQKLTYRFDLDGTYDYTKMLLDQIAGNNDSWAIRWYASVFLKDRLTLYPGRSLIRNIGTDASGTHGDASSALDTEISLQPVRVEKIPLEQNEHARNAIKAFLGSLKPSLTRRVVNRFMHMGRKNA